MSENITTYKSSKLGEFRALMMSLIMLSLTIWGCYILYIQSQPIILLVPIAIFLLIITYIFFRYLYLLIFTGLRLQISQSGLKIEFFSPQIIPWQQIAYYDLSNIGDELEVWLKTPNQCRTWLTRFIFRNIQKQKIRINLTGYSINPEELHKILKKTRLLYV